MTADAPPITLAAFLLARIAETEALLVGAVDDAEWMGGDLVDARALVRADAAAKQRIVKLHCASIDHGSQYDPYCVGCWEAGGEDGAPSYPCLTVRIVASVYADHPDFDPAWA